MSTALVQPKIQYDRSYILLEWKEQMYQLLQAKYPGRKLSKKKVYTKLDRIIQRKIDNPKVTVINNYTNQSVRTDLLSLIDLIEDNHLIIGGGGTLFYPHNAKKNLLLDFILWVMDQRDHWKSERKKYKKGTPEYIACDIQQNLMKLIINSLYGCMGYPGFVLYNVFIAEAITNQGKHIITTAISCFEGFLGDNIPFDTKGELYSFIRNVSNEYRTQYKGKLKIKPFRVKNVLSATVRRLIEKCTFKFDQRFVDEVTELLEGMSEEELTMLYYKNNLLTFLKNDFCKSILRTVYTENGPLMVPYSNKLKDKTMQKLVEDLWQLIETYVFYNYPIYDRVRKASYTDKARSLYTDTDSVFISLDHLVQFSLDEVLNFETPMDPDMLSSTIANVMMIFVNYAIDKALKALCKSINIPPEWAARLIMKNEFFFKKILFTDKKKRYISLALLQEGVLLNDGKGMDEIKGFDFKKAVTKEYLKDYYTKIALEDVLYPPEINPGEVFCKMAALRDSIQQGVRNGDMKYFKQAAVKTPDQYKKPYQTQGVTAILYWNALCPEHQLEFPNDVNIVPVVEMRFTDSDRIKHPRDIKVIDEFARSHPDNYARLEQQIYLNNNPDIRHMGMRYIATPKNPDIPVPKVIYDIIDYDKIVNDAIGLFLPVMKSIGINSLTTSGQGNVERMTNIVDL